MDGTKSVQFLSFSSGGSYVITWERPPNRSSTGGGGGGATPNLKVWDGTTGCYLYGFSVRNMSRSKWPPIRWTYDEMYAFYLVGDGLCVYPGRSFSGSGEGGGGEIRWEHKIRCPGLQEFSLPSTAPSSSNSSSSSGNYLLTTFVPETKGKPARITLLRYTPSSSTETPLASKSFYQAEECTVHWSPRGDSALALTSTTVDTSGSSYYGSTNLYLLLSPKGNSSIEGQALGIEGGAGGSGGGPVHAVAWNPSPTRTPPTFTVISGRMPALTTTHNGMTGSPIFSMGNAHRNTLCYAPHGRFLMVGGFGNLAGGMDFWDVNKEGRCVKWNRGSGGGGWGEVMEASESKANCAVGYGWSPCSRWLAVSTTSPRMNVENGVSVYRYDGQMVGDNETVTIVDGEEGGGGGEAPPKIVPWEREAYYPDRLLAAEWVPASRGVYPDRPQTPPPKRPSGSTTTTNTAAAVPNAKTTTGTTTSKPVGRYVPPCARRAGGGGSMDLAERMRREREGGISSIGRTTGSAAVVGGGGAKLPVGMSADNKTGAGGKSKNALRKERQREAKKKREAEEAAAAAAAAEAAAAAAAEEKPAVAVDPVKRAKKLKKTLKQIAELKAKDVSGLNDDQKRKIATEEAIVKELAELGI